MPRRRLPRPRVLLRPHTPTPTPTPTPVARVAHHDGLSGAHPSRRVGKRGSGRDPLPKPYACHPAPAGLCVAPPRSRPSLASPAPAPVPILRVSSSRLRGCNRRVPDGLTASRNLDSLLYPFCCCDARCATSTLRRLQAIAQARLPRCSSTQDESGPPDASTAHPLVPGRCDYSTYAPLWHMRQSVLHRDSAPCSNDGAAPLSLPRACHCLQPRAIGHLACPLLHSTRISA